MSTSPNNDNPFESSRAYTLREFRGRAPMCERSVYNKLERGELRARHIGAKLVITNAHEWFENLPAFRTGQRRVGGAR
jgi:hypothetical protein